MMYGKAVVKMYDDSERNYVSLGVSSDILCSDLKLLTLRYLL
jgi:hypothetical protein